MRSLIGGMLGQAPVSYAPRRSFSLPWTGRNDATAQMEAYGGVGTLFSIVTRTSNATSQVDWSLYRKSRDARRTYGPDSQARRQVLTHAALDLWDQPNPFMNRAELVESVQQHLDLTGEGWTVIVRDPRSPIPLELWPVRPDRMTPIPHPTRYISGYVYSGPNGEKVPLGLDEVLFLRYPNPLDPYRGLGPVQAAMVDIDSARYSAQWNRNFFVNSAEPGGIIQVDKRLTDDEFDEMTTRWREQHQGVAAAHRVAVIEQGTWVDRNMSMRDMQFEQLRNVSRDIIREAFGIHGHMLGNSTDINKANAEAGESSFAKWLIYPRVQRFKAMLNTRLLPLFGATDLEFDHLAVVPPDRESDDRERDSKTAAAATLVGAGWDPDEVLSTLGLPPMTFAGPATPVSPETAPAA